MYIAEKDNEVYLNLRFRKADGAAEGLGYTDADGNYIFELEASNENLDLQDQITLQSALMESKDFFLKNGVVSNDHQHRRKGKDGELIVDNSMVIGRPISVRTEGKSTIVKGRLFKTVAAAKPFIDLLKANADCVRGSVGGVFPEVVKDPETGVEKITHVLWNDLALTCSPVNDTVGYAVFAKSLTPAEFVKALNAGCGTDSAKFEGGRALIPEDAGAQTLEAGASGEKEILRSLAASIKTGEIDNVEQAEGFLLGNGFTAEESRIAVREIIDKGGIKLHKSFSERIAEILKKSNGGSNEPDEEEKTAMPGQGDGDGDTIDLDGDTIDLDGDTGDEGGGNGNGGEGVKKSLQGNGGEGVKKSLQGGGGEGVKKSLQGGGGDSEIDGTELIKSLAEENEAMHKSMDGLQKQIADIGEGLVELSNAVARLGGQKMPPRSVMGKSLGGAENGAGGVPDGRPDGSDFAKVQDVLRKSVQEGEITLLKSSIMSSEFQRQMATGEKMSRETYDFLRKKINGGK